MSGRVEAQRACPGTPSTRSFTAGNYAVFVLLLNKTNLRTASSIATPTINKITTLKISAKPEHGERDVRLSDLIASKQTN